MTMSDDKQLAVVEPQTPLTLLRLAIDKDLDVDKLREFMALEREWRADQARAAFAVAMTECGRLKQVVPHNRRGKTAGSANFGYADYPQMVATVTPWLAQCGLSFTHREDAPVFEGGKVAYVMVFCRITHNAGHFEECHFPAVPDDRLYGKVSPSQLIQMAITYGKRQSLALGLGVATAEDAHDDDSSVVNLISDKQVADLQALIDEVGADPVKFKDWLKVESLDDLATADYGKAVKALEAKRKQPKKE